MPLPRSWSEPASATTTVVGDVATTTAATPGAGFNLGADSVQTPVFITAPANSSSAASISFGVPVQNTFGYDAMLTAFVQVVSASVATISAGVGSASIAASPPVATSPAFGPIPVGSNLPYTIPLYVPNGYWAIITATQPVGTPSASVNAIWQPV